MTDRLFHLLDRLYRGDRLTKKEFEALIANRNEDIVARAQQLASEVRHRYFGNSVYIRGLIEVSNICKNDCLYCGIRASNKDCRRYRLDENAILDCCREGYRLGLRTFVLQGGEDGYFTDDRLCTLIGKIKANKT